MVCQAIRSNVKRKKKNSKKRKVRQIKNKIKEIKKQPRGLEKNITEDSIKNIKFQEFSQPILSPTPTLTKIETPIEKSLESDIASIPVPQTKEKETQGNYTEKNEPQYSNEFTSDKEDEKKYESEFQAPVLSQTHSRRFKQQDLASPKEIRSEINDVQRGIETNIIEQKRKDPFETQEEKYREVKF